MQAAADLLSRYRHLSLIGKLAIGQQTLARAWLMRPEVVLVDLDTAGGDGLQAIAYLRHWLPEAGIIALTLAEGSAYGRAAQEAGADELVVKARLVADLLPAIGRASKRRRCLSRAG